jgi:hypothetical protein
MCDPISLGAAALVSSVGMGIYSTNQQAAQASASMAQAQSNAQTNVAIQNQQSMMNLRQTQASQAQQMQQSQQQMAQQMQQTYQNQQLQQRQQANQLRQQQTLAYDSQRQQLEQLQSNQRLQQEQAAANRNLQIEQINNALRDKYTQQKDAVRRERNQLMVQNETDRRVHQSQMQTSDKQMLANAEAANRVYVAEQATLNEKRKEAAFEAQTILAKSIGAKGKILATGRTGQSVGLLALDTERQAGVATAQQEAMLKADYDSALIAMDNAYEQNLADNRKAESSIGFAPNMPYLPKMPSVPNFVGFDIPT